MRASSETERCRAGFGLAVLAGVLLAFLVGMWIFPAVGAPAAFVALGLVAGAPVFLLLRRSLGAGRALLLALLTAASATVIFATLAFGAWLASGYVS